MIKKISLLVLVAVSFIACKAKVSTEGTAAAPGTPTAEAGTASVKDPVCGMEKGGENWTEFTVTGTDTTWFCSPHCKDQYVKNPDKYKKQQHLKAKSDTTR